MNLKKKSDSLSEYKYPSRELGTYVDHNNHIDLYDKKETRSFSLFSINIGW